MAVYGDMLNYFPELFREFPYYKMTPQTPAAYNKRENLGLIRGVFQFQKKGELKRDNDTLSNVEVPVLWTRSKLKLGNFFIENEGITYKIVDDYSWRFEGGFNVYELETVTGNTDEQEPFDYVNLGQNDYA